MMPPELHDDDMPIAVLEEHFTRGKARAYFTRERGIPFTVGTITLVWFRRDPEFEREQIEDGVSEPDEGWPLWACDPNAPDAAAYWYYNEGG